MALADIIIALHDGRIIGTGDPVTLLRSNGYVSRHGFSILKDQKTVEILENRNSRLSRATSNKSNDIVEDTNPSLTDIRRKNGELSVYKYYFKNAGSLAVGMYVLSITIWIF
jgi:hypothetical protein